MDRVLRDLAPISFRVEGSKAQFEAEHKERK